MEGCDDLPLQGNGMQVLYLRCNVALIKQRRAKVPHMHAVALKGQLIEAQDKQMRV